MTRWQERVCGSPVLTAIAAWVTARVLIAVAWAISSTSWFGGIETSSSMRHEGLFLWDGTYYRDLAESGYAQLPADVQRFFPAYPVLGRATGWLFGGNVEIGLLVVSNVAALVSLSLVHVLVRETTGDRDLAAMSAWWLALFPAASVLVFAYSESIALAFALGALLAVRRGRLVVAFTLGVASGLTRPTGALLALAVLVVLFGELRQRVGQVRAGEDRARAAAGLVGRLAVIAAPGIGAVGYLAWLQRRFDTWRVPLESQREFRAGWHEPVSRLVSAVVDVASGRFSDVFNASFAVGTIVVIVLAARRLPPAWTLYAAVTLVVALAANNINSLGRYAFAAFPLVVMVAAAQQRLGDRFRWLSRLLLPASGLLMAGYALAAWSGRMIP